LGSNGSDSPLQGLQHQPSVSDERRRLYRNPLVGLTCARSGTSETGSGLIGSPLPLRPFKGPWGIPRPDCIEVVRLQCAAPRLRSPSRVLRLNGTSRRAAAPQEPSWGFAPYDTYGKAGYASGQPSPDSGRSGVSHPFSDVLPAIPFRPYFVPERPWDSPFRALIPETEPYLSPGRCSRAVTETPHFLLF